MTKHKVSDANKATVIVSDGNDQETRLDFAGPDSAKLYISKSLGLSARKAKKSVHPDPNDADTTIAEYLFVISEQRQFERACTVMVTNGAPQVGLRKERVQMTRRGIQDTQAGISQSSADETGIGWLTFWTLPEGHVDSAAIIAAGQDANVPSWMLERIRGRTPRSAWQNATQLGAKGVVSANQDNEPSSVKARYLTREPEEGIRLIIREVQDADEVRVSVTNVAITLLSGDRMTWELTDEAETTLSDQAKREAERLMEEMEGKMDRAANRVAGSKIRQLILSWLNRVYRVCVRGTGGVYFVPRPTDEIEAGMVEEELIAIRNWIASEAVTGLFTTVELFNTASTDISGFADAAIEEVKAEIEDVAQRLKDWQAKDTMNAGSLAYSAGTQVDRLEELSTKVDLLKSVLGDELEIASLMIEEARKQARNVVADANVGIQEAKAQREAKKTGTAKDRASRAL